MQKPKVDKSAEKARKEEGKLQKAEAARLDAESDRRKDQRQRRGAGMGAFLRTGERGLLSPLLGG